MPRKTPSLLKALRTADDVCRLTTGKRLNEVAARVIDLWGQNVLDKKGNDEDEVDLAEKLPYIVLGINPDCPDFILKAAYKSSMKFCHPDSPTPDAEKASRINQAYEAICKQRGIPK